MEQIHYNIADTIKFLATEYKKPYTEDDIDDFVSRGELTPCFPYEGALFKTFIDSSKTPYNKISYFKGFIESVDRLTSKNIGKLSTKYKKVCIWEVVINNDLAELTDYETVQEYRIDHQLLAIDLTMFELDTISFFGQNSDCIIHYKTTKLCNKYDFIDKQGIEITYNIYRAYCHFHISQLANIALEYPKSDQGRILDQSDILNIETHEQNKTNDKSELPSFGDERIEVKAKELLSERGKKGADLRHAKNREMKAKAIQLWEQNPRKSYNSFAKEFCDGIGVEPETVARWIGEHERKKRIKINNVVC